MTFHRLKVALVTEDYKPSQENDEFWSTAAPFEVKGKGYKPGGVTLRGQRLAVFASDNECHFFADDVAWIDSTISARGAVIYRYTGVPATSPMLGYIDFGATQVSVNGRFAVKWNSVDGIAYS